MSGRLTYLPLLACVLSACSATQPAQEPSAGSDPTADEANASSASTEETPAADDVSDDEAALLAQIEESAQIADSQSAEADSADDEAQREVIYRLTPDGLRIEVQGAHFTPKAEAVKMAGGYGVKLTILASTDAPIVLYSPQNGPLAFGGMVVRGEKEKFGDKREGGMEVSLSPGAPVSFNRSWPGPDQKPLKPGEKLELHVGLWGLGTSSEDRRPVNRFLVIKMVADQKGATPSIEPPPR